MNRHGTVRKHKWKCCDLHKNCDYLSGNLCLLFRVQLNSDKVPLTMCNKIYKINYSGSV